MAIATLSSSRPCIGKYLFLPALFFSAKIILSGIGKGDWPKPNLYIFFPIFFNLFDSSLIVNANELNDPRYKANPYNRCYFCKERK